MKQANPYPLRLEITLSRKIRQLSEENNRSYNKEIEYILKKYVKQHEDEHGKIKLPEMENSN